MWVQREIRLPVYRRGFHLVTREILEAIPEIKKCRVGLLNILLKHTSASLTLNENADPDVRVDFESFFTRAVPENQAYYLHNDEGSDDLPAHLKSSILGASLNLPITQGRLNLGTWQGIYLCEHRNHADGRSVVLTLQGDTE